MRRPCPNPGRSPRIGLIAEGNANKEIAEQLSVNEETVKGQVRSGLSHGQTVLWALTGVLGLLFLVGLWTPVAGTLLAVSASCIAILHPADALSWILLGGLSAALALLGPGAWSVDARLFGWKRIELPDRKS